MWHILELSVKEDLIIIMQAANTGLTGGSTPFGEDYDRPIIIITSNNEKELPDAFLRRCFFHYIKFPDQKTMQEIVNVHFPKLKKILLKEALDTFYRVRDVPGLKKKPSTSELLDWIKLLLAEDVPADALRNSDNRKSIPPFHGALLKNEQDVHLFEQLVFMESRNR